MQSQATISFSKALAEAKSSNPGVDFKSVYITDSSYVLIPKDDGFSGWLGIRKSDGFQFPASPMMFPQLENSGVLPIQEASKTV